MARLKVFSGHAMLRGVNRNANGSTQKYVCVAATSQKQAAELLHETVGRIRNYYSETGNEETIAVATSEPGTVFYKNESNGMGPWLKYERPQ